MRKLEDVKEQVIKRTKDLGVFDKINFVWKETKIKDGLGQDINVIQVADKTRLMFYLSEDLEYLYVLPSLMVLKIRSVSNVAQIISGNLI